LRLRIEATRDCYVGLWHIDHEQRIVQLFPNEYQPDHFLAANRLLEVPVADAAQVPLAQRSAQPQFLHLVAATNRWEPQRGKEPFAVFDAAAREKWVEQVQGLTRSSEGQVTELVLPLTVK
jgi:hypothetical protein